MATLPPTPQAFGLSLDSLAAEISQVRAFIDLMKREQTFLKQGETEALLPLIERKNELSHLLAERARSREADLNHLGFPPGRPGMDAWLNRAGDGSLRDAWQTLLELAAEARDINTVNGKLIGLHMSHHQQAFETLMRAADRAMTYGPDGQQQTGLGGRFLGSA